MSHHDLFYHYSDGDEVSYHQSNNGGVMSENS